MLVKHLIQELQRFNPEARLALEVDVHGVSLSAICNVLLRNYSAEEIEDLDARNDELIDGYYKILEELKKPHPSLSEIEMEITKLGL